MKDSILKPQSFFLKERKKKKKKKEDIVFYLDRTKRNSLRKNLSIRRKSLTFTVSKILLTLLLSMFEMWITGKMFLIISRL